MNIIVKTLLLSKKYKSCRSQEFMVMYQFNLYKDPFWYLPELITKLEIHELSLPES